MAATEIVRARVDAKLKTDATAVLEGMGLSISDAIRLTLIRITEDKELPFQPRMPNRETQEALTAAEKRDVARFESVDALFDDLNGDDDE